MRIEVTRDSVHAGDDGDAPHLLVLEVSAHATAATLIAMLHARSYVPLISSGRAAWCVRGADGSRDVIAVFAQQWPEARVLRDAPLPARVHLVYFAQHDADIVLDVVRRLGC